MVEGGREKALSVRARGGAAWRIRSLLVACARRAAARVVAPAPRQLKLRERGTYLGHPIQWRPYLTALCFVQTLATGGTDSP